VRIAIFTNTYHPTLNGVANCVDAYRRGLESRGHEVYVFAPCPGDYDPENDPPRVLRFPAVPMPGDWDYDIAFPYSKPVLTALRETGFDMVHTQHPMWVGVWGGWFARWAGLPLVTTVHTEYELYARLVPLPEALVDAYLKTSVTSYLNKAQVVTTPVASARQRLRAQGVVSPIEIVPNPIELDKLPTPEGPRIRQQHDLAPDSFVMGFIGRLSPEKNLPTVLEAAAKVMAQNPRTEFLMVGDGAERRELQTLVEDLGIADRVTFTGVVEHEDVPHYQAALDVFMTASMSETQPLSYTEAMAVGTPVVAVRAPGSQDMIEHGQTGLLSSPEEGAEGLATQVLSLMEDPSLGSRISQRALQHVRSYDLSVVTDRLLAVYALAQERHQAEEEPPRRKRRTS
jgi:1,2-diacylglycerol 3-alpha-glucosyltransferase